MEENNELMAELEQLINKESERIQEPTNAMSEGLTIFRNLLEAIDKDLPESETQVFIVSEISADEAKEKIANDTGKLVSNGISDEKEPMTSAGRVEILSDDIPADKILSFLGDLESALVLSQWKDPGGLLTRVKRKSERLDVMVLGNILMFQKTLPTGDKVVKSWDTQEDDAPERSNFDSGYEYKLVRNTYTYLMMPQMLKHESPTMYEQVLNMVKKRIARDMGRNELPPFFKSDEGDDD